MLRRTCFAASLALALGGCNPAATQETQYDDARNPHYKQAQQDLEGNNPNAAVADYEAALGDDSKLAGAHYELAIIYGDKLNDPVGSIYHFQRYLELAPNSDKAAQVKDLIQKESQAFAASLPNSPAQSADDYAKLQDENAALKKQVDDATHTIAQLQKQLSRHHGQLALQPPPPPAQITRVSGTDASATAGSGAPSGPTPPPATNAAPAGPLRAIAVDTNAPDVNAAPPTTPAGAPASTGPARSYKVVKGDSIWKIAHKMYPGDTKNGEDKILAANQGIDPKRLKLGQVLVIP
jgi:LysM repeat protein